MALGDDQVDIAALWAAIWTEPGPPLSHDGRPSVTAVMVSSVDGHVTERGRVGALTGPADQAVLHRLRMIHDAVLVGATTVRVEGYDALLTESEQAERIDSGKSAQPVLCILSARAALDREMPALRAEDLPLVLMTGTASNTGSLPDRVDVVRAESDANGELDIASLFRQLRSRHNVRRLLCEGGPTLLGSLVRNELLDELILVMSPRVSGGEGLRAVASAGAKPHSLELVAHAAEGDFAFLRYRLRRGTETSGP